MNEFKSTGRLIGEGLGTVIGDPIKFAGKKLNNTFITEIGEGVKKASAEAGETTGSLIGGTYKSAAGYIQKDEKLKQDGFQDLAHSAKRTVKGMEQSLVQTWNNGSDVVTGFVHDDQDRMINGARGLAKAAAIAALTVGVFEAVDIVDGQEDHIHAAEPEMAGGPDYVQIQMDEADTHIPTMGQEDYAYDESVDSEDSSPPPNLDVNNIETINDNLEGSSHEETGVPFVRETVTLPDGELVSGVYPDFNEEFSAQISESLYLSTDDVQFHEATEQLSFEMEHNDELRSQFTPEQLAQIRAGETPDGFVWHHHQEPGRLELVDEQVHAQTGHSGGRSLWGGGSDYR